MVSASSGRSAGGAIISLRRDDSLITEAYTGSNTIRDAWFPIDTYVTVVRHGRSTFQVTLSNAGDQVAEVRLIVHDPDGSVVVRSNQILPPKTQVEFSQVELADKGRFKGSVRVVSDVPIAVSAQQVTLNVRGETIISELSPMTSLLHSKGPILFPRFVDGPETATQYFVLNSGKASTKAEWSSSPRKESR